MRGGMLHQSISLLPAVEDQDQGIYHKTRASKRHYLPTHLQPDQIGRVEGLSRLPRKGSS